MIHLYQRPFFTRSIFPNELAKPIRVVVEYVVSELMQAVLSKQVEELWETFVEK